MFSCVDFRKRESRTTAEEKGFVRDVKYVKQNKNINGRRRRHKHVRTCNASDLYNFIYLFSIRNGVFLFILFCFIVHRTANDDDAVRDSSPEVHFLTPNALANRTVTAEYLFQSFLSLFSIFFDALSVQLSLLAVPTCESVIRNPIHCANCKHTYESN